MSTRWTIPLSAPKDLDLLLARAKNERWTELAIAGPYINDLTGTWLEAHPNLPIYQLLDLQEDICDRLASLTDLRLLWLRGNEIREDTIKPLNRLTQLKTLHLSNNNIGDYGLQLLTNLDLLEEIWLQRNGLTSEVIKVINEFKNLKSLNIGHNNIGIDGLKEIKNKKNIEKMEFTNAALGDDCIEIINGMPNLKSLWIQNNSISARGIGSLAKHINLSTLGIGRNAIGDEGTRALGHLTSLEFLDLCDCEIGDEGAQALGGLRGLTELWLNSNRIGHTGAQAISGLSQLRELHLDGNNLGNKGTGALKPLSNLEVLSLDLNGISDAGTAGLASLHNLKNLSLAGNSITGGGASFLRSLQQLTVLLIWGNSLKDEGAEIVGSVAGLTNLNISGNKITPQGVSALTSLNHLEALDISGNSIGSDGARAISLLTSLTGLDISANSIGPSGAEALGSLVNLRELNIDNNSVSSRGALGLAGLTNLRALSINYNDLGPAGAQALVTLSGLARLDIAENGIGHDGAKAISRLKGLTQVDLRGNSIGGRGAKSISTLPRLQELIVRSNNIGKLGFKALQTLRHLKYADLQDNKGSIDSVEELLGAWAFSSPPSRLDRLYLDRSLASSLALPPEVLGSGEAQAIFAAYRAGKRAVEVNNVAYWNTAKLLVVGDETAGKTSLIRFLVHNKPRDPDENRTCGIDVQERVDITRWGNSGIILNIWDFAGQVRTHGTHRFFFSERCLYLLVLQDRREDDRSIDYWLKAILNRTKDAAIIVAINKCDGGKEDLRLDEAHWKREYPNIIGFCRVACNDDVWSHEHIRDLRSRISEALLNHPQLLHVRAPIARHWLEVKDRIAERAKAARVLPLSDFHHICQETAQKSGNPDDELFNEAGRRALLLQLHYIGVVIAYGLDVGASAAKRQTLLDPNWLIRAVYKVLEHPDLRKQNGRFSRTDLENWLNLPEYDQDRHEFILSMMEDKEIRLCFRLRDTTQETYLVPAALPPSAPDYGKWPDYLGWSSESLRFRYKYSVLPKELITRFLVEAHNRLTEQPTLWATGAVLQAAGCRILVTADLDRRCIDILVGADSQENRRRDALNRVQDNFDRVHSLYEQNSPEARVPLPDNPTIDESYHHLLVLEREDGKEHAYRPVGAGRRYTVHELLDGVRHQRIEPRDKEDKRFGAPLLDVFSNPPPSIAAEPKRMTSEKTQILFLAANPLGTTKLRLDQELRDIREEIVISVQRDEFDLQVRHAVRPKDLIREMLSLSPKYVHFSGHGGKNQAIHFEAHDGTSSEVSPRALGNLFSECGTNVHCVLLNACYSEAQARAIVKHIPFAIGMNNSIGDKAAIAFAAGFYRAIGAGRTVPSAFRLGTIELEMYSIPEESIPVLLSRDE